MITATMITPLPPTTAVPLRSRLTAWAGAVGLHGLVGLALWATPSLSPAALPEDAAAMPLVVEVSLVPEAPPVAFAASESEPEPEPESPQAEAAPPPPPTPLPEPQAVQAVAPDPAPEAPRVAPPPLAPPLAPRPVAKPAPPRPPAPTAHRPPASAPAPTAQPLPPPPVESATPAAPPPPPPEEPPTAAAWQGSGLDNPPPLYPRVSRLRGEEGLVVLRIRITPGGQARDVHILDSSGFPDLDSAAAGAVRGWRFLPARKAGAAVEGTVDVPIRFRLKT